MGAGKSKEEYLYEAVQASNHQAVKTLRRDGASLEWVDKEGRTPLILACTRGDLYDMVITLLNEGAKLDAYRSGPQGGFPLHHAAKRGLERTVVLLLSRGANPLAINDDGLTPLDMARNRSHVSVVRIIEDRICLFSGTMRELSGPGFLEMIVPQFVTKKIWVVVLPTESDPRKPPKNEVVIYQNTKVAVPRTVISLSKAEIEEPKFTHHDPALIITATDKTAKVRFKFLSENEGDKAQLERFYRACARGIHQSESLPPNTVPLPPVQIAQQGLQALMRPQAPPPSTPIGPAPGPPPALPPVPSSSSPSPPPLNIPSRPAPGLPVGKLKPSKLNQSEGAISEDDALAMAIDASILSASAEGVSVSPSVQQTSSWDAGRNKWRPSDSKLGEKSDYGGWVEGDQSSYSGWAPGSSGGAGPSRLGPLVADSPSTSEVKPEATTQPLPGPPPPSTGPSSSQSLAVTSSPSPPPEPSAPPLPEGPIHYPSVDTSPIQIDYTSVLPDTGLSEAPSIEKKVDDKGGQCVVCWDAAAEAVCIPCGHLAGCMDCLTEIKSKDWGCPVCRASIQQVLKVYAV